MNRIKILKDENEDEEFTEDVSRIVDAFAAFDIEVSRREAATLWYQYSDSMCAGWMLLPKTDADIIATLAPYYEIVEIR